MNRLLRSSGFVALPLLTLAATASAECAWVLWNVAVQRQTGQTLGFPTRSFDTRQACEQVMFAWAAEHQAEKPEVVSRSFVFPTPWTRAGRRRNERHRRLPLAPLAPHQPRAGLLRHQSLAGRLW